MSTPSLTLRRISAVLSTITCRSEITVMIVLQAVALYIFGSAAVGAKISATSLVLAGLFGLFAQGFCSVLNDISDVEADKIHHPNRPLPSGRVSRRQGRYVVATCFVGAVACGATLGSTSTAYIALACHLGLSLLYSFPQVQFGRHWLFGPLTLATSTVCGIIFILSSTELYRVGHSGIALVFVIGGVCYLHYLLVIPLKDIRDLAGDAAVGGTSLAMRLPKSVLYVIALNGYLLPWIVLFFVAGTFPPYQVGSGTLDALQLIAIVFGVIGVVVSLIILFGSALLAASQRFCWFAELGILFLFQLALPIGLVSVGM